MLKKSFIGSLAILLAVCFLSAALALEMGNDRKGKYTYRKVYQACSKRGEVESPRPLLSPDTKTQAQWTRVFEKKDFDQFRCQQEWSKLTDEQLRDIYSYLFNHAADSPSPAKCK